MLIVSRRVGEVLSVGEAKLVVLGVERGQVRIGVEAPRCVQVKREEAKCCVPRAGRVVAK